MGEGEDSLEAGLRAVYRHRVEHESVLEALGVRSQVLLRDAPDDPTPVLRVSAKDAADDERYQVLGEIARGGIGVVLKSRDRDLARDVALKVLRKEYAENAEVLERFVEEAQIGGQLQHPGIVPVYGMGMQSDGRPHFAMKLVKGRTLSALLEERTDPARGRRRFLAIFEQVCLTVAYAHARGVIHRDLKPSNIMVGAFGEVQVVDWGFAKVLGTSAAPQRKPDQTMIATVRSDKEGGRVEELDERADVFALGAVLCEILTGQPPYVGKDLMILAAQGRLEDAFRRLAECGAEAEQIEFTKHCLAPASAERPKDAGAVATAIAAQLAAGEERAHKAELEAAEARAHEQEERARLAEQEVAAKEQEAHAAKAKRQAERARARQREERRRAESEHRRRLLVIAIAAVLLLAVAIGGGGYLISAGEEHARRERVEMAVSDALQKALELEGARELAQALVSAKAAADLARAADSATLSAAEEAAARIQAEIKRDVSARRKWERDRKLLDELRAV
jgi:serine/threonine-protein kinase